MMSINYNDVLKIPDLPSVIKNLVLTVQDKGGTTVGTWLKNVPTVDLLGLKSAMNDFFMADPRDFADAIDGKFENRVFPASPKSVMLTPPLMIDILSSAEGLDIVSNPRKLADRSLLLEEYIRFELLKRKGLKIIIYYENMTLNEDASENKKPILKVEEGSKEQLLNMFQGMADKNSKLKKLAEYMTEAAKDLEPTQTTWVGRVKNWAAGIVDWVQDFRRRPIKDKMQV